MTKTVALPLPPFLGPRWLRLALGRETESGAERSAREALRSDAARRQEEHAWIHRSRGGDPHAFRLLVDRYRDRAYETALWIVRSPEEAEEVAQDAFVRAWNALEGFREEARFSTWLYRIVTRRALDVAETSRRRRNRETAAEDVETLPAPSPSGERVTDALRLERILADLTPLRRAIITLFYLRERTVAEISEILDLPSGTVKTHLHRSRAELRRAWLRRRAQESRSGLQDL